MAEAKSALAAAGLPVDPVIEAYKKDIDRTLLRERLKRTVEERLRDLMSMHEFVDEARQAMKRAREQP